MLLRASELLKDVKRPEGPRFNDFDFVGRDAQLEWFGSEVQAPYKALSQQKGSMCTSSERGAFIQVLSRIMLSRRYSFRFVTTMDRKLQNFLLVEGGSGTGEKLALLIWFPDEIPKKVDLLKVIEASCGWSRQEPLPVRVPGVSACAKRRASSCAAALRRPPVRECVAMNHSNIVTNGLEH